MKKPFEMSRMYDNFVCAAHERACVQATEDHSKLRPGCTNQESMSHAQTKTIAPQIIVTKSHCVRNKNL